jgi:membrane associated rhomboid family serine protease
MTYTSQGNWGFQKTPKPLQNLIFVTAAATILCSLLDPLFSHLFGFSFLENVLSLSLGGIKNFFIWQPLTYLFVQDSPFGLSISFLFTLFFNMYLLWVIGGYLLERLGTKSFFTLYFASGILSGIFALLLMLIFENYPILSGPSTSLLAIFMVWTMLYPENEIILFIASIKIKWLLLGLIGLIILTNLAHLNFLSMGFYLSSIFIGYMYGLIVWDLKGPFPFNERFDRRLKKVINYIQNKIPSKAPKAANEKNKGKIVDLQSGKPSMDDEMFVDAMLSKISAQGEGSLSWSERERMKKISSKKQKDKKA